MTKPNPMFFGGNQAVPQQPPVNQMPLNAGFFSAPVAGRQFDALLCTIPVFK
jgi:hypothetical protein